MARKEYIEQSLKDYFPKGAVIDVTMIGVVSHIEVTYTDGPSASEARGWIDDHIPDVANITLWRDYSAKVIENTLRMLYDEDMDVQLRVEAELISQSFCNAKE